MKTLAPAISRVFPQAFLAISERETTVQRRGFRAGPPERAARLERIGATFLDGYHAALQSSRAGAVLRRRLEDREPELRGFAYEGAAMACGLLDLLLPWTRSRFRVLLEEIGPAHAYMIHIGSGWALARLRRRPHQTLRRRDPLLGWLCLDGYGFHEGYFHADRAVRAHRRPRRWSGYALRAFDQGLGRSLWFVEGAHPSRIAETIAGFPAPRQADLWSGAGLACAYAGGVPDSEIQEFASRAAAFRPHAAQGASFAAAARQRAGNPAPNTDRACRLLGGVSAQQAADLAAAALAAVPEPHDQDSYEQWRGRLQAAFAAAEITP